jgi:ParB-like chromosome segregation protein Spo0J
MTWDEAVLETITITDLFGTDPYLKRAKIQEQIEIMGQAQSPLRTYPLVYEINNEPLIIDGHDRLMAMELLGLDKAPVWIVKE